MGAYDIGPRIGIQGEAEFRASIRAINTEFKTLRTEMAAVKSEFEGQEKSEKSLTKQKEVLTRQIELQKQKIKEEQSELERYSKSENATAENIEKFKQVINTSTAELNKLNRQLKTVDTSLAESNDKWKTLQTQIDTSATKINAFGKTASSVGNTLSKDVTVPLLAAGTAAVKACEDVEDGANNVIKATGATGKKAEELRSTYKDVAGSVSADMSTVGDAMGQVSVRFGFTGQTLDTATKKFLELSKVTGVDATQGVQLVSRMMGDANIPASEYSTTLDMLTKAVQTSGISLETLTEDVTKYGAPMRALGFDTQSSIAIFSQWEKAGVTTDIAFAGMKKAISSWMKDGKDAETEFKNLVSGIQNGSVTAADAMDVFGKKGGPDMVDAIQQGRFSYEEYAQTIADCNGTLDNSYNSTLTASDKAKQELNKLKVAASDVGDTIINTFGPSLESAADAVSDTVKRFGELDPATQQTIVKFLALAAAAGPVVSGVGKIASGVGALTSLSSKAIGAISKLAGGLGTAGTASAAASGELAATGASLGTIAAVAAPAAVGIGLLVAAIAGEASLNAKAAASLKDITDRTNEVKQANTEALNAIKTNTESVEKQSEANTANADTARALMGTLDNLITTEGNTATGKQKIAAVVDQLNQIVPNLNLAYDGTTNSLNLTNQQIEDNIDALKRQAQATAYQQALTGAYKSQADAQRQLAQTTAQIQANDSAIAQKQGELNAALADTNGYDANARKASDLRREIGRLQSTQDGLKGQQTDLQNAIAGSNNQIDQYRLKMQDAGGNINITADQQATLNQKIREGVDPSKAYAEAVYGVSTSAKQVVQDTAGAGNAAANNLKTTPEKKAEVKADAEETAKQVNNGFGGQIQAYDWGQLVTLGPGKFLAAVKAFFKIQSPSVEMHDVGVNVFQGFSNAINESDWLGNGVHSVLTFLNGVNGQAGNAQAAGGNIGGSTNAGIFGWFGQLGVTGVNMAQNYATNVRNQFPAAQNAGSTLGNYSNQGATSWWSTILSTGTTAGTQFVNGVSSQKGNANAAGKDVAHESDEGMKQGVDAWSAGEKIVNAANTIITNVRKAFGIASPSKEFYEIGYYCIEGLINGFQGQDISKIADWIKSNIMSKFGHGLDLTTLLSTLGADGYKLLQSWGLMVGGGNGVKGAMSIFENLLDDDVHGYSQSNRWGPDYDCSSSIIYSLQQAGMDTGGASYTGNMSDALTSVGWQRLPVPDDAPNGLQAGDILLNDAEHVGWWLGNALGAFHDDYDGAPGDSSGREANRTGYYNRPWNAILRLADQGGGGGNLESWISTALALTGQSQDLLPGLVYAAQSESGGDPNAVNNWDSNAAAGHPSKGLLQTIDSTFDAYKLPGYDNIFDPVANAIAAIRYMIARYGSVGAVVNPRLGHWYGYEVGSRYIPYDMPAMVHQGEMIIPKNENPYANSGGTITGGLAGPIVSAINQLGDRLEKMERTIEVNQVFTDANPTPSQIARKTKTALKQLST